MEPRAQGENRLPTVHTPAHPRALESQHPKLVDFPNDPGLNPIPRYACKMATGAGKTVVMAMLIAWAFCNRGTKPGDPRYPRRVLVVCPNLTIRERLSVLRPGDPGSYYEKFDIVPSAMRPELAKGKVLVTNWHRFNPEAEAITVGGVQVGRLGEETPEAFARARLGDLWDDEPLMVLNDEGHHAYRPAPVDEATKLSAEEKADREEATVWVSGLDRINAACGIGICVDLSATPFYIQGSGYPEGSPFPWIVSDFSLVDAIESGITKIPRLPAIDNTGRPDPKYFRLWEHIGRSLRPGDRLPGGKPKPEAVYREAEDALLTLASEWKERFEQLQAAAPGQERTPPVMIVVCDNTDVAMHFHQMISGETLVEATDENGDEDDEDRPAGKRKKPKPKKHHGMGLPGFPDLWNESGTEVTLRIDSRLLAAAESEDPKATREGCGGRAAKDRFDGGETWRARGTHPLRGQRQHVERGLGCGQRDAHPRPARVPQPVAVRAGGGAWAAQDGLHSRPENGTPDRGVRRCVRSAVLSDSLQGPRAGRQGASRGSPEA